MKLLVISQDNPLRKCTFWEWVDKIAFISIPDWEVLDSRSHDEQAQGFSWGHFDFLLADVEARELLDVQLVLLVVDEGVCAMAQCERLRSGQCVHVHRV